LEVLGRTLFSKSRKVLNVGSGPRLAKLGPRFDGMRQYRLDIDPRMQADYCCDALEMKTVVGADAFDAVFCSHNLEHYSYHHVPVVLNGMFHILKPGGFVEIWVPDILAAIRMMAERGADLEDILYVSPGGPIATLDIIYGWRLEIERSNQPWFAHKTAFTPLSLHKALGKAGFVNLEIYKCEEAFELRAVGFKP
jgi:SAM-dependent methyltransferase